MTWVRCLPCLVPAQVPFPAVLAPQGLLPDNSQSLGTGVAARYTPWPGALPRDQTVGQAVFPKASGSGWDPSHSSHGPEPVQGFSRVAPVASTPRRGGRRRDRRGAATDIRRARCLHQLWPLACRWLGRLLPSSPLSLAQPRSQWFCSQITWELWCDPQSLSGARGVWADPAEERGAFMVGKSCSPAQRGSLGHRTGRCTGVCDVHHGTGRCTGVCARWQVHRKRWPGKWGQWG